MKQAVSGFYKASGWTELITGGSAQQGSWNPDGANIYNSNTGNVGIGTHKPGYQTYHSKRHQQHRVYALLVVQIQLSFLKPLVVFLQE